MDGAAVDKSGMTFLKSRVTSDKSGMTFLKSRVTSDKSGMAFFKSGAYCHRIRAIHREIHADFVMSRTDFSNIHTFAKIFHEFVFSYQKYSLLLSDYSTTF